MAGRFRVAVVYASTNIYSCESRVYRDREMWGVRYVGGGGCGGSNCKHGALNCIQLYMVYERREHISHNCYHILGIYY